MYRGWIVRKTRQIFFLQTDLDPRSAEKPSREAPGLKRVVVHEDDFEPPRIAKFKETAEKGWYFDGIIYAPELPPKVVDQNGQQAVELWTPRHFCKYDPITAVEKQDLFNVYPHLREGKTRCSLGDSCLGTQRRHRPDPACVKSKLRSWLCEGRIGTGLGL